MVGYPLCCGHVWSLVLLVPTQTLVQGLCPLSEGLLAQNPLDFSDSGLDCLDPGERSVQLGVQLAVHRS